MGDSFFKLLAWCFLVAIIVYILGRTVGWFLETGEGIGSIMKTIKRDISTLWRGVKGERIEDPHDLETCKVYFWFTITIISVSTFVTITAWGFQGPIWLICIIACVLVAIYVYVSIEKKEAYERGREDEREELEAKDKLRAATAKLEEEIRRLLVSGPKGERELKRELKQDINANSCGLWAYGMAKKNLKQVNEIVWDRRTRKWKLVINKNLQTGY